MPTEYETGVMGSYSSFENTRSLFLKLTLDRMQEILEDLFVVSPMVLDPSLNPDTRRFSHVIRWLYGACMHRREYLSQSAAKVFIIAS